jgi:hemerythrin
MPFSNWHVSYSINIDELDCQHKLFTIFDVLYGIFVYQNKVNSYTKIIEELVSYSDYHFRLE